MDSLRKRKFLFTVSQTLYLESERVYLARRRTRITFIFYRSSHEYQIFQKIAKLEYEFPEGFDTHAQDLVTRLLVSLESLFC